MSNRRAPLTDLSTAANSPCRPAIPAAMGITKRARSFSNTYHEGPTHQAPPSKRVMRSKEQQQSPASQSRRRPSQEPESRFFTTRRTTARSIPPTSFNQRLLDAQRKHKRSAEDRAMEDKLENVRQWQRHYRKAFPQFVFYFESVPHEVRMKCSKQLDALGSTEVKFFSRDVTHVVTTRPIPTEAEATAALETESSTSQRPRNVPRTINPSLLEKPFKTNTSLLQLGGVHGSLPLTEASQTRKSSLSAGTLLQNHGLTESKRQPGGNVDVLSRARERGMKIWALEKFQRMMSAMFETDTGEGPVMPPNALRMRLTKPPIGGTTTINNNNHESQLSQLLRNERHHGPADRDRSVATQEIIPFRGPYIYVRDMEGKTRPVLVREFPRVADREDGAWPQFRSVHEGRCPFVVDPDFVKRQENRRQAREQAEQEQATQLQHRRQEEQQQMMEEQQRQIKEEEIRREKMRMDEAASVASRTRGAVAQERAKMQPPARVPTRSGVVEAERQESPAMVMEAEAVVPEHQQGVEEELHVTDTASGQASVTTVQEEGSEKMVRPKLPSMHSFHGPVVIGGEPAASGVQPSNITSAIRSQMISSTAAGPGAKAATNKEVYSLKRKILEKSTTNNHNVSVVADVGDGGGAFDMKTSTTMTTEPASKRIKTRSRATELALQQLMNIGKKEEAQKAAIAAGVECDNNNDIPNGPPPAPRPRRSKLCKVTKPDKDPKPGYCENCREKFDDFDEHVTSRNHRKFALNTKNWADLDALLMELRQSENEE
ncbi:MAG: hypothetical protein M1823_004076 [Watsoniomyces obsoletus]|nr:MAG: hypothetical protein M1823_004076 [Watsoniomyces obsoletus]